MARLNTANPLVCGTPQRRNTENNRTSSLDDSQLSDQPCSATSRSPTKQSIPEAKNQSRRQKARSSTLFDILPDGESAPESETSSKPTGKQTRPRTLGIARVNSLLLPTKQRPRSTFRQTPDYDKENDVPEHTTDGFRTPDSTPTRRTTPGRRSAAETTDRQSEIDDQGGETDDQGLDNSFDSLDDFIVSDDDEPSSHEASDHETPDTKEEATPPPSPVRSPRKRLMRGRKPASETGSQIVTEEQPPSTADDLEPELDDAVYNSRTASPEDHETSPSPIFQGKAPAHREETPEYHDCSTHPVQSHIHSSEDLIQHLEDLDLHSDEEETPQSETPKSTSNSEDEFASKGKKGRKPSTPITPSTTRTKETPPTTIRAQKKAEAARKREARAQVAEFNEKKIEFAQEFLEHLDGIFDGRIANMTKETGGIKLIWTKNFRNTAGRATVRSERVFTREGGVEDPGRRRYDATIELSEKVLDTEDKILCTLTHEYCHLLDILITENRGKGAAQHGTSFKQWGYRCTQALKDHPIYGGRVEVTTKHTYEINHKYVWACVGLGCPFEVGRHSKSVDPVRHRCGRCRGYLKQIKPVPRAAPKKNYAKVVINLEDD